MWDSNFVQHSSVQSVQSSDRSRIEDSLRVHLVNLAPPIAPRNTASFFRYLFPRTHQRTRERLSGLRHETLPYYRVRAQSRIYQLILKRQHRKQEKRVAGRGILPFLQRRRAYLLGGSRPENDGGSTMAQSHLSESTTSNGGQERVPGSRRQKVFGYLKAANELRHSYQAQWSAGGQGIDGNDQGITGSYPDVEISRNGEEEMVLFPSYARHHIKKHPSGPGPSARIVPGSHEGIGAPHEGGDADYWKKEWEKYEDDNAIVDVDVRGWIYTPHKGPLNRKQRLLIAVARQLSGIPSPSAASDSNHETSTSTTHRENVGERPSRHEEEAVARAAASIVKRGEGAAEIAARGGYSQEPNKTPDSHSLHNSRTASPAPGHLRHVIPETEYSTDDDDPGLSALAKRKSWNTPTNMTSEELHNANAYLMARLKPFMNLPLIHTPITVFFFNDEKSQSRSIHTDESGHFTLRASLDFVPTSVRVLASEKLSATEKVIISEARGVSLISDIDDTIKHSAIASGAREIFKNTFIRDLSDLTILGVKEWYSKLYSLGVNLHYVSNSPWQLYPTLHNYFSLAGIPKGSFHLKQYTGMLQGIFEPAAERKRSSLERLMRDFPQRKFILVGDSGEADLEVYTDVVLENPRRILAVFIRDVTTEEKRRFFDQSLPNDDHDSMAFRRGAASGPSRALTFDVPDSRPALPSRPRTESEPDVSHTHITENLIDFEDEPAEITDSEKPSYLTDLLELDQTNAPKSPPPTRPKPSALRSFSTEAQGPTNHDRIESPLEAKPPPSPSKLTPPPKPRRPSTSVDISSIQSIPHHHAPRAPYFTEPSNEDPPLPTLHHVRTTSSSHTLRPKLLQRHTSNNLHQNSHNITKPRHPSNTSENDVAEDDGYTATARRQITNAYNALPSIRSASPARWVTGASGGDPMAGGGGGAGPLASHNKKEEIWKRRWARSEEIMHARGVVLKTWRVGSDVMDECVDIVVRTMRKQEQKQKLRDGADSEDEMKDPMSG